MLAFDSIEIVREASERSGYEIVFSGGNTVWVRKRRALVGLLLLLKYEICSEADLVGANDRLTALDIQQQACQSVA